MNTMELVVTSLTSAWNVVGTAATLVAHRQKCPAAKTSALPGVTVLKPLAGCDARLRENLESFFLQDHDRYEILFGIENADDPAVPVARELIALYPQVRARLIIHGGRGPAGLLHGENPKVKNLRGIIDHAEHDLVLISDSNVRAPASYVREAAATYSQDPSIGLVTNLFVGSLVGGSSLGGQLECVQLTGFCAAGAALPTLLGDAAVVGKSMLFSRSVLAGMGGLARVADVLAEDFVLGKLFQHAGFKVVIAQTVLENSIGKLSVRSFCDRQLRWSMLRYRLRPAAFLLEPLTSPLVVLPFAWTLLGPWALLWALSLLWVRDLLPWLALKGTRSVWAPLLLGLLRDPIVFVLWAITPLKKRVSWRGHRVRVGAGTVLFAES